MPVTINGQGPFRFVLDTGANRTVLTPQLTAHLGLPLSTSNKLIMTGVTGSAAVPTVAVEHVKVGEVELNNVQLPVAAGLSEDVSGTLGVDALPDTRVLLDFANGRIQIRKAHRETLKDGFRRIRGQCRFEAAAHRAGDCRTSFGAGGGGHRQSVHARQPRTTQEAGLSRAAGPCENHRRHR